MAEDRPPIPRPLHPESDVLKLHGVETLFLMYLVQDGLLVEVPRAGIAINGVMQDRYWKITEAGRDFIRQWAAGREIE